MSHRMSNIEMMAVIYRTDKNITWKLIIDFLILCMVPCRDHIHVDMTWYTRMYAQVIHAFITHSGTLPGYVCILKMSYSKSSPSRVDEHPSIKLWLKVSDPQSVAPPTDTKVVSRMSWLLSTSICVTPSPHLLYSYCIWWYVKQEHLPNLPRWPWEI